MKKYYFLIIVALILGLVLTGCSLLSNIGQAPATGQSGVTYLTKTIGPTLDLVGLWHFDEGSGTKANDSSGNNIHGTLKPTGSEPTYVPGNYSTALLFDGVDKYVDFGAAVDSSITTAITLEAWIKYSYADRNQKGGIISNDVTYLSKKGYDFFLENGNLGIDVGNGTVRGRVLYTMPAPDPANPVWCHVAATWDGSTVRLYVNGAEVGTAASLSGNYTSPNQATYVGRINSTSYPAYPYPFKGIIDEVRIWRSALANTQLDDMTPPGIDITKPLDGDIYLLKQIVSAEWSTDDNNGTGVASESETVPIDTSTVGEKTFEVTAEDYAMNTDTNTVNYVVYGFGGILPPFKPEGISVFKLGRTIPVKFQLWDSTGDFVSSAEAKISWEQSSGETLGTEEGEFATVTATTGDQFRYDDIDNQYIFNFSTKTLSTGTWKITIIVNDSGCYSEEIVLK